jgi:hypothetical protein
LAGFSIAGAVAIWTACCFAVTNARLEGSTKVTGGTRVVGVVPMYVPSNPLPEESRAIAAPFASSNFQ